MAPRDVTREAIHIFDHIAKIGRRAAFTRRTAMTARVPRENRRVIEI